MQLLSPSFFGTEWMLQESYASRVAASRAADTRIVLVSIPEASGKSALQQLAVALRALRRAGATVIAFDASLLENRDDPKGDRELADALRGAPAVLGMTTGSGQTGDLDANLRAKLWRIRHFEKLPAVTATGPRESFLSASGVGSVRLADPVRTSVLHYQVLDSVGSGDFVPSLALETARQFLGGPRRGWVDRSWKGMRLRSGSRAIPINEAGQMFVRWSDRGDDKTPSYPVVPLQRILQNAREDMTAEQRASFDAEFRGKIAIVGFTAPGPGQERPAPVFSRMPAVEIHANAIDNIINSDFNAAPAGWLSFVGMLGVVAIFGALFIAIRSQMVAAWVAVAVVVFLVAAGSVALREGLVLTNIAAAIAATLLTFLGTAVLNYRYDSGQARLVHDTFGNFVAPPILKRILANPQLIRLKGERREVTILFSDIRAFTTISDSTSPEAVVQMLSEFLTRMVEILLSHGGTFDKFVGNAIMGFWNAPTPDADHPRRAVTCAIAMVRETARLRARWKAEGKPAIRVGIGINTGEAVVGNVGSPTIFGYTAIGDTVQLASRLVGKNRDFGTDIVISEMTHDRLGNRFDTVMLEEITVKGRVHPVKIFEVRAKTNVQTAAEQVGRPGSPIAPAATAPAAAKPLSDIEWEPRSKKP